MKKIELLIFAAIILLALILRLYKIDRPLADWHSWRQADTAAVARNFIKEGYTPFVPKFDDMSAQANGQNNPNRYRFVEFPIYNSIVAAVWLVTGVSTLSARLVTVAITIASTIFLYLVVKHFSQWETAALAAFFFATIPYNVFYSSTILPGPFMVFSLLALYYFFIKFLQKENFVFLFLSVIFTNLALLSWPIAVFFLLPIAYLTLEKYGLKGIKNYKLWIYAILSVLPLLAWRIWILKFPAGIPNWRFLINEGNIRFKGAFFRWILAERLGKLILTVGGFALATIGVIKKPGNEKLFYYSLFASCILYVSIFASGNVRHDYYQIPLIPAAAIFMAIGTRWLVDFKSSLLNKYVSLTVVVFLLFLMYALGWYEVQGYYWINKPQIITAGEAADRLLPKDATVVAPYNGDSAFLYATNRYGYPIVDRPLTTLVGEGTKYLVTVDVEDAGIKNIIANCIVLEKTTDYAILEMTQECLQR